MYASKEKLKDLDLVRRDTGQHIYKVLPYAAISKTREAHMKMIRDLKPTHWITFNFRIKDLSIQSAEEKLNRWFWRMHEKMTKGSSFDSTPSEKRISLFGYPEHDFKGMLHYHAPVYVPPECLERFALQADKQFRRIVGRGDAYVVEIDVRGCGKIAHYSTKGNMVEHFWICPSER